MTLLDTRFTCEDYNYEYYVEWCEYNEREPKGENSDDYWEWVGDTVSMYIDDLFSNLKFSDFNDCPVIITGTLGLWNGNKTIYATRCEKLTDAIRKCFGDCDDAVVTFENGRVYVTGYHHDGTNSFTIQMLSKTGIRITDKWYNGCNEIDTLPNCWIKKFPCEYLF